MDVLHHYLLVQKAIALSGKSRRFPQSGVAAAGAIPDNGFLYTKKTGLCISYWEARI